MQPADPLYYLHNFQAMIDTLRQRDGDLLDAEERGFIAGFTALPIPARALLVRMVMRRGVLFRASRLAYAEILDAAGRGTVSDAVAPLVSTGWVEDQPRLTLEELFRLLPKPELMRLLALPRSMAADRKAAVLEGLRARLPGERRFCEWCAASTDQVYRLTVDDLCDRLRLMFFGNFRQTLTEFVLADLGIFKFEKTAPPAGSRPFRTRGHVTAFLTLHRCREMLHAGADPLVVQHELPPPIADCEWLEERRQKLRFQVARALERSGALPEARTIYADCTHPEALRRLARGTRRSRTPVSPPEFTLTLEGPDPQTSVETQVRRHLQAAAGDSAVYYVENALITSLFGLLCWRAVFAPVQGAFFHAFHHGPADLSSAGFRARRCGEFESCLAELRTGSYKDTIRRHFAEKFGVSSPFVAWGLLHETLLETSLRCFPAEHLAHWFEWILRSVTVNRCGFADLVQFWPAAGRYRLIEVKGPGDRLQDNQRRWFEHCLSNDMPVSVCRVRWHAAAAAQVD